MDTYLCMLYVSIEQEKALKKFFLDNGWKYRKPDPTHYTDQIGPIDLETSLKEESSPLKVKLGAKKRPVQSVSLKAKRRKGKNKSDIEDAHSNPIIEIVNDYDHEVKDIGYNDDDGDDDDDFIDDENQQDVPNKQHVSKLDGTVGDASCQSTRTKYKHTYSDKDLLAAYKQCKEENMSVKKAARIHNIPTSTLRDRVLGKVDVCNMQGKVRIFSVDEEQRIFNHIKIMAKSGGGYSKQECLNLASELAFQLKKRKRNNPLSGKWYRGFVKRWPEMKDLKPVKIKRPKCTKAKRKTTKATTADEFFNNLESFLNAHKDHDTSQMVFNVNEFGLPMEQNSYQIVSSNTKDASGEVLNTEENMMTMDQNTPHTIASNLNNTSHVTFSVEENVITMEQNPPNVVACSEYSISSVM